MDLSTDTKEPVWHFISESKIECNLKQRIKKGLTEDQCRKITKQLVKLINDFHSEGRLLRFITPISFLLDKKDNIVAFDTAFSDFMVDGISTRTDCLDSEHKFYTAPEATIEGHKHGVLSDYFSLGTLVYCMLTRTKPKLENLKVLKKNRVKCLNFWLKDTVVSLEDKRMVLVRNQYRFIGLLDLEKLSKDARDFVEKLMICRPDLRLGSKGIGEIIGHSWLNEFIE